METTQVKTVNVISSLKRLQNLFKIKSKPKVDPITGKIDLKYNMTTNDQDYFLGSRLSDEEIWVHKIKKLINYRNNG